MYSTPRKQKKIPPLNAREEAKKWADSIIAQGNVKLVKFH